MFPSSVLLLAAGSRGLTILLGTAQLTVVHSWLTARRRRLAVPSSRMEFPVGIGGVKMGLLSAELLCRRMSALTRSPSAEV